MGLSLLNLQSDQKIEVEIGKPVVIGRGGVTGCSDKRVSRKHCQLTCTSNNKLQVTALHTNPCFFMKGGLPPVQQLKKDEEKILDDGDYLGLLPDSYWYEIIVNKESPAVDVGNCSNAKTVESPVKVEKTNNYLEETQNFKFSPLRIERADLPSTSAGLKVESDEASASSAPKNRMSASPTPSPSKTIDPDLEKTKRLPLWMYEIDDEKDNKKKTPVKTSQSSSSSEALPSWMLEIDNEKDNKDENPLKRPPSSSGSSTAKKTKTSDKHINNEAVTRVLDMYHNDSDNDRNDNKAEINDVTMDDNAGADQAEQNVAIKADDIAKEDEVKKPDEAEKSESNKKDEKEGYEDDVVAPDDLVDNQPPQTPPQQQRRPFCQYGSSCYRKNPQHKIDTSHPGDPDYVRPEERPICPYGAACYRQNPVHRVEYQHPTRTPAPRPQPARNSPSSASPTKRKRKTNYRRDDDDDEEDEYDLDDPFINDASSDDYVPTDDESSDEEESTDLSQTPEEENIKRLKKEAKKFTKKKKKD